MLSKVLSGATSGIDAYLIEVETHIDKNIPGFSIVGLPDNAVRESRERIGAAFSWDRLVSDLVADDFDGLRRAMAKVWGPVRLGNAQLSVGDNVQHTVV